MSENIEAVIEPGQTEERCPPKLAAAFVKAQAQMKGAAKDSDNPFFKSKYSDLASVVDALKEPFAKNGLAYTHDVTDVPGGVRVRCILIHESGESWYRPWWKILMKDQTAQGEGSAATYGRRYTLQAASGVVSDDDDGNAASGKAANSAPRGLDAIPRAKKMEGEKSTGRIVDVKAGEDEEEALFKKQLAIMSIDQLREKIIEAEGHIAKTKDDDKRKPVMLTKLARFQLELDARAN